MIPELIGYLFLGLISGFSELLPVSASGNAYLFARMLGLDRYSAFMQLFIHIGCMAALILCLRKQIAHLYRENRLARLPAKRRRRQPDTFAVLDGRVLMGAMLPMAVGLLIFWLLRDKLSGLPLTTVFLAVTGILVYIPQYFPGGNRDSRGMSRLDGWLLGLMGGLTGLCGLSRMGAVLCAGLLRGCDRKYILDMGLLLTVAAIGMLILLELLTVMISGFAGVDLVTVLGAVLAAGAAFAGAYGGISAMRYLAAGAGFSGFAYVNWGLSMFAFILYLLT